MVSVALNSKHCTNLNLTTDLLMPLYQQPQYPSIQIMLLTHIHLYSTSARAAQIFTDSLPRLLLSCEQGVLKATNTTVLQGCTSSPQCWGFLNCTIMLCAHSANTPRTSVLMLQLGKCLAS